jgi:hypothetical protein
LNETNGKGTVMFVRRRRNGRWQLEYCCQKVESKHTLRSEINKKLKIIAHIYFFGAEDHLLCYPVPEEGSPKINFKLREEMVDP